MGTGAELRAHSRYPPHAVLGSTSSADSRVFTKTVACWLLWLFCNQCISSHCTRRASALAPSLGGLCPWDFTGSFVSFYA